MMMLKAFLLLLLAALSLVITVDAQGNGLWSCGSPQAWFYGPYPEQNIEMKAYCNTFEAAGHYPCLDRRPCQPIETKYGYAYTDLELVQRFFQCNFTLSN